MLTRTRKLPLRLHNSCLVAYAEPMAKNFEPVRIAIVGCGAIAELGHLPGALVSDAVVVTTLVDRDLERARMLAARFGVPHVESEIAAAADHAEAAVVALPPHLHRIAAETLFGRGLHVLMEKPLAASVVDSIAITAAARAAGRVLVLAMPRRFAPSSRYLKAAVASGMIGQITRYVTSSGTSEAWPAQSPYMFDVATSGGGALIGNACHDIDLLQWLLGPIDKISYSSDSEVQLEANCLLECRMQNGAVANIEVSRTRTLANTIRIEGEHATLVAPLIGTAVQVIPAGIEPGEIAPFHDVSPDFAILMGAQLDAFAASCRGEASAEVDGAEGLAMLELIERCYASTQPLVLPWDRPVALQGVLGS